MKLTDNLTNFKPKVNNGDVVVLEYPNGSTYRADYFLVTLLGDSANLLDLTRNTFVSSSFTKLDDIINELTKYGSYSVISNENVAVNFSKESTGADPIKPFEPIYKHTENTTTTTTQPVSKATNTASTSTESTQKTNSVQPENDPAPKS